MIVTSTGYFGCFLEHSSSYYSPVRSRGPSGSHSLLALDEELSCFYGEMTPPDQAHTYDLHVFTLDCLLDLKTGFYLNELYHKMEQHILAQYTLKGIYDKM